jgi:cyclophilin family peptidyl-prolyl cis-trans isomerase
MLLSDTDAIARANAARVLGAAEDQNAFNLLQKAAVSDEDSRVRVSAIRSLGSLKDAKAAGGLLERGENLLTDYKKSKFPNPSEKNELLEIATTLGRMLPNSNNERAIKFLDDFRYSDDYESPETEIALALISPGFYLKTPDRSGDRGTAWRQISSLSQGVGEFSKLTDKGQSINPNENPEQGLLTILNTAVSSKAIQNAPLAVPDVLRAYAAFKSNDLQIILRELLKNKDIIIRATAAELLSEQPANKENIEALKTAFTESLKIDKQYNDAQLAILSALIKLDKKGASGSLKLALDATDILVRRQAAQLIKQNDLQADFPKVDEKVGTVKPYNPKTKTTLGVILNTNADYVRAVSRKSARAILTTEKGTFTIEFFPEAAPLTVDNFIKLARKNYFNGLAIHRVVPNFVMQDGDPRGDGNGGPGWEIRDEINEIPFERGTVGMALSGRDTGGSQWFVCHSPQPHLDGGYTVFGKVSETDMKVVDNLVRGDKILTVKIVEGKSK